MPKTAAELVMDRETRVTYGPVPHRLFDAELAEMNWQFSGNEFLLRGEGEHYFHYRPGLGIRIERGETVDETEESLWLNGSVYAAIASLNGLVPIHASAVAINESVFAFTGPAGAGKSTLVAALGDLGLPLFCDDTLVLDLSQADRVNCLPGHKRLKLKPDALARTGAVRQEKVSKSVDKFYSKSAAGDVGVALPLAELIFLEDGEDPAIFPIEGFERFTRMQDDHYTAHLYAGAQHLDRAKHFEHLASLAGRLSLSRFVRPRGESRFRDGVALVAAHVTSGGAAVRMDKE